MEINAKHKVLYALYAEYQKDDPDMPSITFETLEMESRTYKIALLKLQNEGFIDGLETFPPHTRMEPRAVILDSVMPTRLGIDYVEKKLEIEKSLPAPRKSSLTIASFAIMSLLLVILFMIIIPPYSVLFRSLIR